MVNNVHTCRSILRVSTLIVAVLFVPVVIPPSGLGNPPSPTMKTIKERITVKTVILNVQRKLAANMPRHLPVNIATLAMGALETAVPAVSVSQALIVLGASAFVRRLR